MTSLNCDRRRHVKSHAKAWTSRIVPAGRKTQIDLLFDRADRTISVCEIKYSDGPYAFDRDAYEKLKSRIEVFRQSTRTTKAIQSVLITANGVKPTNYRGHIRREVTGDDLFAF